MIQKATWWLLKKVWRVCFTLVKWAVTAVLVVEISSFLIISISNYILYGHVREGSRAVYDPYTLFLQSPPIRPTIGNADIAADGSTRTIWMFGGSTMRGATDDDARTIPSFLTVKLNGGGQHFRVLNFGINSFNSLLEIKYLEKALIEQLPRPDLIVFYDGANDTKYFVEHRTPDGHYGYRRVRALIEDYYGSWLGLLKPVNAAINASFTRELYDKLNQVFFPLDPVSTELAGMVDTVERRYDFADKLAQGFGAKFLVIWQPMLWTEGCPVNPAVAEGERTVLINSDRMSSMRHNFTVTYSAIAQRLANKPYFINFATTLCGRDRPLYQPDGVHLTDDGRRAEAEFIGKLLLERYFSPAK